MTVLESTTPLATPLTTNRPTAATVRSRKDVWAIRILLAITLAAFSMCGLAVGAAKIAGLHVNIMQTASMAPQFPTGSLVVSVDAPFTSFHVGDLLVFSSPTRPTTMHRVHAVDTHSHVITTMGDAMSSPDFLKVDPTYSTARVLYANHVAGYLYRLAPWLLGGLLVAVVVSRRRQAASIACITFTCVLLALSIGARVESPFLHVEYVRQGATSDNRAYADLVNVGVAPISVTATEGGQVTRTIDVEPGDVAHFEAAGSGRTLSLSGTSQWGLMRVLFYAIAPGLAAVIALTGMLAGRWGTWRPRRRSAVADAVCD